MKKKWRPSCMGHANHAETVGRDQVWAWNFESEFSQLLSAMSDQPSWRGKFFLWILEVVWVFYSPKNAMENGSKNQKEAHFLEKPLVYLVGVIFVVCFRDE